MTDHADLIAACESVGIETHVTVMEDSGGQDQQGNWIEIPVKHHRSPAELLAELEAWLWSTVVARIEWENALRRECARRFLYSERLDWPHAIVLRLPQTARTKAALAAFEKIREKK